MATRVSLLVKLKAVLQRLVHNLLHPGVHRRVNLDASLQEVFKAEAGMAAFEFLKDIFNDRRRLEHLVLALRRPPESGAVRLPSPCPEK